MSKSSPVTAATWAAWCPPQHSTQPPCPWRAAQAMAWEHRDGELGQATPCLGKSASSSSRLVHMSQQRASAVRRKVNILNPMQASRQDLSKWACSTKPCAWISKWRQPNTHLCIVVAWLARIWLELAPWQPGSPGPGSQNDAGSQTCLYLIVVYQNLSNLRHNPLQWVMGNVLQSVHRCKMVLLWSFMSSVISRYMFVTRYSLWSAPLQH